MKKVCHGFLYWIHFIGCKNMEGKNLSKELFQGWLDDPHRKVICVFCGTQYNPKIALCTKCNEYKGIEPFIQGWNDNIELNGGNL